MKALTVVPLTKDSASLDDVDEPPGVGRCTVLVADARRGHLRHRHRDPLRCATAGPRPGRTGWCSGHESLGRVVEAPAGGDLAEGDLVVGIVRHPDPVPCANCAVGEWDFCRNGRYTEHGIKEHDGFLSERYRIHPEFAVKVDPKLGILGVLMEPTSVVAKAWEQVDRIGPGPTGTPDGGGDRCRPDRAAGRHDRGAARARRPRVRPDDRRAQARRGGRAGGDLPHRVHRAVGEGRRRGDRVHRCLLAGPRRHGAHRQRRGRLPDRCVVGRPHGERGRGLAEPVDGPREQRGGRLGERQPSSLPGGGRQPGQGRPGVAREAHHPAGTARVVAPGAGPPRR